MKLWSSDPVDPVFGIAFLATFGGVPLLMTILNVVQVLLELRGPFWSWLFLGSLAAYFTIGCAACVILRPRRREQPPA